MDIAAPILGTGISTYKMTVVIGSASERSTLACVRTARLELLKKDHSAL